jgi:pilus assembly protein CpaF
VQQRRGNAEALPLLLTLSSGVQGFTTIHASSARQALTRLRFICQLAEIGSELPMAALNALVSESIDIVVHCTRTAAGPRVSSVLCVEDLSGSADAIQFTSTEVFARATADSELVWTGHLPVRLGRALADSGVDMRALLASAPPEGARS